MERNSVHGRWRDRLKKDKVKEIRRKRKSILKRENLTLVNADEVKEIKRKRKRLLYFRFFLRNDFTLN